MIQTPFLYVSFSFKATFYNVGLIQFPANDVIDTFWFGGNTNFATFVVDRVGTIQCGYG